jgi:hypothetical protein
MTEQPMTRRQARELERRRDQLGSGDSAVAEDFPRTGPIEIETDTASNQIVVDSVTDVTNMTLILPESGVTLTTGAIELPVLKPETGEIEIVSAAAAADVAHDQEQIANTVTGITPIAARVHQRSRKRASVFPTKLRQGWGVVHLVLVSAFILLAIFLALVGAVLLGAIKLF